jgi:hypothetical protein
VAAVRIQFHVVVMLIGKAATYYQDVYVEVEERVACIHLQDCERVRIQFPDAVILITVMVYNQVICAE